MRETKKERESLDQLEKAAYEKPTLRKQKLDAVIKGGGSSPIQDESSPPTYFPRDN